MNIHGLQNQDLDELKLIMSAIEYERYNPCMRRINGGFVRVRLGGFDGNVLTINLFYGDANANEDDTESCSHLCHEEGRLPLALLRNKALTVEQKREAMGKWTLIAEESIEKKTDVGESVTTSTTNTVFVECLRNNRTDGHAEHAPRPDAQAAQ